MHDRGIKLTRNPHTSDGTPIFTPWQVCQCCLREFRGVPRALWCPICRPHRLLHIAWRNMGQEALRG